MPFMIFAYSSNIFKANFDLMDLEEINIRGYSTTSLILHDTFELYHDGFEVRGLTRPR
jgi:hypothetical protein